MPDRRRGATAAFLLALAFAPVGCGDGVEAPVAEAPTPPAEVPAPIPTEEWVSLVRNLSETGGFFDTDNLVSNESSFLNVLGPMRRLGVYGGAYVGVGPDQNFSYMAQQRPTLAFILDIRRDNLLQHVLFKALFHEAASRVEYLSLLLGVAPPTDPGWESADVEAILDWVASAPGGEASPQWNDAWDRVIARVRTFGLELDEADEATLRRFHEEFARRGLDLRFTTLGQTPRPFYPTFGELLAARDLTGEGGSYLASRDDFAWLKALQEANRVIPVVGDLAGDRALRSIGDEVRSRGLVVRAFYVSNVEFYLAGDGTFERFAETVAELPMDDFSVIIRSVFPQGLVRRHPQAQPGDYSTQVLVRMADLRDAVRAGGYGSYWDVVTRDAVDPGS
ncbi:hypothetical protein V3331_10375 [Gaopeijia maritima]|uniref:LIC_10091 family protein n=1 Tax=Gaopeijia maritima TaxID=3119007 RepID=UPI00324DF667